MKRFVLTVAIALFTVASFAQKGNITNAAMAFKDAQGNMADLEKSTKDLMEAKDYIDKACAHPDTKESPKGLMYKGKIYVELSLKMMMTEDQSGFNGMEPEKLMEEGFAALIKSKEVDKKERYVDDVNGYANQYRVMLSTMGSNAYQEEKYEEAMGGLLGAAQFGEILGVTDSNYYFFGGMAAFANESFDVAEEAFAKCIAINFNTAESVGYLAKSLKAQDKTDEAEKALTDAVAKYPDNLDVLIQMTNFYIDNERNEDAEKALSAAIILDPSNTALLYTSGIIYEGMGRMEDAEAAYKKTLSIDPKHTDAKYSLGVFYFNQGADMYNEANKLPFGDPSYDIKVAESKEFFNKSVSTLEEASAAAPKDISILEALKLAYGKAGMVDKFKETKAKIAELKG